MGGGGCRDDPVFEKQVCTQLTPSPLTIISHTGQKWQRNRVRTSADQLPALYIIFRARLELMREAGEPMECGIFDFYKVYTQLTHRPLTIIPHTG